MLMMFKPILISLLLSAPAVADEYTDHYDNMNNIVVGAITAAVDAIPYFGEDMAQTTQQWAQNANSDGFKLGEVIGALTPYIIGGEGAMFAMTKRLEAMEKNLRIQNQAINALQDARITQNQAINALQDAKISQAEAINAQTEAMQVQQHAIESLKHSLEFERQQQISRDANFDTLAEKVFSGGNN